MSSRCPSGFWPPARIWTPQQNWVKTSYLTFLIEKYAFSSKHAYCQCIRTGSRKLPIGCFFWPRENGQAFSLMFGERSFLNLFRDSRTPLDSIWDKPVTLISFVIVQYPSVGTTWYKASRARNGFTWAARYLRLPRRARGSALSVDRQTLDVFVTVKVLFRIPQRLLIVKIRE